MGDEDLASSTMGRRVAVGVVVMGVPTALAALAMLSPLARRLVLGLVVLACALATERRAAAFAGLAAACAVLFGAAFTVACAVILGVLEVAWRMKKPGGGMAGPPASSRWETDGRIAHDRRRFASAPPPVSNTWYHLADARDVRVGAVLEVRALGRTYALWRDGGGRPVCHEAFCPHLGANLAVGGRVVEGTLECPFHGWRFNADGTTHSIPRGGADDDHDDDDHDHDHNEKKKKHSMCAATSSASSIRRKLLTLPCRDYCGLVMVYVHAHGEAPEFELPAFVEAELEGRTPSSLAGRCGPALRRPWRPLVAWDVGHVALHPTDWVDQASDHAHFHQVHAGLSVPWTAVPMPACLGLSATHELRTYRGDDAAWRAKCDADRYGAVDGHLIFFTDRVGVAVRGRTVEATVSETLELYVGPALMVFHIPFTLGALKMFVSTTPVQGGSLMRVRAHVNSDAWLVQAVAWLVAGVAASQLEADVRIMRNKIRLTKPLTQGARDGPYGKVHTWLNQFYCDNRDDHRPPLDYANDW